MRARRRLRAEFGRVFSCMFWFLLLPLLLSAAAIAAGGEGREALLRRRCEWIRQRGLFGATPRRVVGLTTLTPARPVRVRRVRRVVARTVGEPQDMLFFLFSYKQYKKWWCTRKFCFNFVVRWCTLCRALFFDVSFCVWGGGGWPVVFWFLAGIRSVWFAGGA